MAREFDCNDPSLQNENSQTYKDFQLVFCAAVGRSVNRVTGCSRLIISCGSIIVNATIEVDTSDVDTVTSSGPAPDSEQEMQTQLEQIIYDPIVIVVDAPLAFDIDECDEAILNSCSDNSQCENTDGSYNCTCNSGYPVDISPYTDEPGRICAISCDGVYCGLGQMCQPQGETTPVCTCPDSLKPFTSGSVCGVWLYVLLGVILIVLFVVAIIISVCACITSKNAKADKSKLMRSDPRVMPPGYGSPMIPPPFGRRGIGGYMDGSLTGKPRYSLDFGPGPVSRTIPKPDYDYAVPTPGRGLPRNVSRENTEQSSIRPPLRLYQV